MAEAYPEEHPTPPPLAEAEPAESPAADTVPEVPSGETATATAAETSSVAPSEHSQSPAVAGIGASAGGLAAFVKLVGHLEPDAGLAYVLIQHLDPSHESLLPEILARSTRLDVVAATDGVRLEADRIYVIPPNSGMTLTDGHLRVVERDRARGVHTVIDAFLESLSEAHDGGSIGVILSGAGSDGARGIEAIKNRGGITFAQDARSAQFPSMPESAMATGCIDFVLAPEQIAEELVRIGKYERQRKASKEPVESERDSLETILLLLRTRTGVDFRHYRRGTVERRILRRMLVHRDATHAEYLETLRAEAGETELLCEDLLIGVTRFFRDPETFAELAGSGFAEIMKGRKPNSPVRAWVAGCSGGEETYSIAIMLLEHLAEAEPDTPIQIFGTDLSDLAIGRARTGLYPQGIEADVSPERLARFFVREDAGYRVTRRVRDICVFAKHNFVRDPPFSQIDLVSCRNVLIYFDAALQTRAMQVFHYALRANGILFLGTAESASSSDFVALDKRHKLFRRKPGIRRVLSADGPPSHTAASWESAVESPRYELQLPGSEIALAGPANRRAPDRSRPDETQQAADRAILDRLAPPGVVVNERLEIVQFRGDTTQIIQHASGVATFHLLKLVRPELLARLRVAMEEASANAQPARQGSISIRDGEVLRYITIDVIPFRAGRARERFYAVLFEADEDEVELAPRTRRSRRDGRHASGSFFGMRPEMQSGVEHELGHLREQLAEARRYLQDVVEQYEAANEELRAASEEIQSSNEELRSTNEELETTKEEVQSTNEELSTVNEELRHRNRELAAVSGDLTNVFASTQIPLVIVDSALSIRRFTPIAERVMKVIPSDVGRPLGDVKLRFDLPDIEKRVTASIDTLATSQVDVRDDHDHWWSLSVRPYLTVDRTIDGAVLVFTDIDVSKKFGEQATATSESQHRLLVEAEEARAEATSANLAKMAFLANMSHDLRTPLNAIAGYVDLMELGIHGPLTPEQTNALGRVKRSARHLLSLINDILNFARVETGQVDLKIEPLGLPQVVAALEELVFPQARAKGLSLESTTCDFVALADRDKLQQILLNLVTNAIKFTTVGGVRIMCEADESTVSVTVADTGIGIPADQLDRIFEPFIQVGRSLTNVNHEGVGLGLSISRDLAQAMGGTITVRSKLAEGSEFTVTIPRAS